ncbi:hypothetical protein PV336_16320 [Streptomyces sp. MI02-2A]|uniref:hypothetical protein n=1 Tax=Streptomyces sp. MI02-2A TaxID=3028688 RepID=UPI0029ACF76D|nr:hypothetical protein [Streptomyces sp. MI02-2A]MDX3260787.1 hypothetical protein [Streptomyces sp. MI02-2A]
MPKIQVPTDILGVIGAGVDSENPLGQKTITLLVQTGGGEMVLRLTPDVAADIYKAVCEE